MSDSLAAIIMLALAAFIFLVYRALDAWKERK